LREDAVKKLGLIALAVIVLLLLAAIGWALGVLRKDDSPRRPRRRETLAPTHARPRGETGSGERFTLARWCG
jgi:hypothetical protein